MALATATVWPARTASLQGQCLLRPGCAEQETLRLREERRIAEGGCKAIGLAGDASKPDFVRKAIERTIAEFNSLDIVMCSAAIHPFGDVIDTDEATWDRGAPWRVCVNSPVAKSRSP